LKKPIVPIVSAVVGATLLALYMVEQEPAYWPFALACYLGALLLIVFGWVLGRRLLFKKRPAERK